MTNGRSRSAKAVCAQAIESASRGPDRRTQRPPRKSRVGLGVVAAILASLATLAAARQPSNWELPSNCEYGNPAQPWLGMSCWIYHHSGYGGGGSGGHGGSGGGGGNGGPSGPIGPYVPEGPPNPDLNEEKCTAARIRLEIRRYLGPILESSDPLLWPGGTLRDAAELIDRGQILPTQRLTVRMSLRRKPECAGSDVSFLFNNKPVSPLRSEPLLSASNGEVFELQFDIPSDLIHFSPQRGNMSASDPRPIAAVNRFEASSSDSSCLCVTIRDIELELRAMSPVLLVHGIGGSGPSTWGTFEFDKGLEDSKIVYDADLTQDSAANTVAGDAESLRLYVPQAAESFGSERIHIVAHSKGGLDTRLFLSNHTSQGRNLDNFPRIVSLITIATPHNGSPMGDITEQFWAEGFYAASVGGYDLDPANQDGWTFRDTVAVRMARLAGAAKQGQPGFQNLGTDWMANSHPTNVGELARLNRSTTLFWAMGTNADASGDWAVSESECGGMFGVIGEDNGFLRWWRWGGATLLLGSATTAEGWNSVFQFMARYRTVGVVRLPGVAPIVSVTPRRSLMENDCVVARDSAFGVGPYRDLLSGQLFLTQPSGVRQGRDHSAVLRRDVASTLVVPWLITSDLDVGGLKR